MTKELTLPTSVSPSTWNADTAAMMEFAGLTWFEGSGESRARQFAPSGIMAGFIASCRRTGLDPTAKQIYAAQMGGKWTVLIGVDGMRVVAQRTGQYDGQDPIEWQMVEDGPWSTVPGKGAPYAARIAIYRKGVSRPLVQTVTMAEFGGNGGNWKTRPCHMLGIRAETHGFRRLYPMELSGLYTPEDFQDESTDTADAVSVEQTEDWAALIGDAETKDAITEIVDRAKLAKEFTDAVRTVALTRYGMFTRGEQTEKPDEDIVDAEVVEENETDEARAEREAIAEHEATLA